MPQNYKADVNEPAPVLALPELRLSFPSCAINCSRNPSPSLIFDQAHEGAFESSLSRGQFQPILGCAPINVRLSSTFTYVCMHVFLMLLSVKLMAHVALIRRDEKLMPVSLRRGHVGSCIGFLRGDKPKMDRHMQGHSRTFRTPGGNAPPEAPLK